MFNFASLSDKTATALAEFTLPKIFTSATAIIIYLFIILSLISESVLLEMNSFDAKNVPQMIGKTQIKMRILRIATFFRVKNLFKSFFKSVTDGYLFLGSNSKHFFTIDLSLPL